MQESKEFSQNWLRVDPFDNPILKDAPQHQPEKFSQYVELKDDDDKVIGFLMNQQQYFFDSEGGWRDENGCHYDKDGQPAGWFVLHPGDVYHEHFYDQDGYYIPTDIENEKNSSDDQDIEEALNQQEDDDMKEYEAP
ncbi:unnamed protein product [Paramecium pentaurelia]|uniref:Uncharacterized protein n=1 Tax=Paramecium pentaurelia TaxID=43138 RepID=A0A8S1T5Q7_9CILI|nr:unnamed protein product [Paramecium pentaurelia]